ncbi:MAG: hypothetical protein A4E65_00991 [Syntrophorhabdus sp. PtaU1.Bin153]|nr:MAG: hypothetical protein A4E65_00991 [Syntrophorhabdus sp. PtaU1.Bin153]
MKSHYNNTMKSKEEILITIAEIIRRLEQKGVHITRRTFEFYQGIGLLPKPVHKAKGKGGKGVHGLYHERIVDLIIKIYDLQREGLALAQIVESLQQKILKRYARVLNSWGFENYAVSAKLKGYRYDKNQDANIILQAIRAYYSKDEKEAPPDEVLNYLAQSKTLEAIWERKILDEIGLLADDKDIELYALHNIKNQAREAGVFLGATLQILLDCLNTEENSRARDIVQKKILQRMREAQELEERALKRIAELGEGTKN